MDKRLELAQDKFIERIGNMCAKFGLNNFLAQLFAVLYLNKRPLSLDELAETLKVSKGNVSINIRELERWGAVKKIWIKGSRKDFYEAEADVKRILADRIKSSLRKRISEVSEMIQEFDRIVLSTDGELTEEEKETAAGYKERLKKIEEANNLVSNALIFMDKIL